MAKVRIQKVLSAAGVGSRRAIEQMVLEGRITLNGRIVSRLPCFVEPGDEILMDGQPVRKRPEKKVYVLLNKPRGVVCTQRDAPGYDRPRATDLVPSVGPRVYCVGRLDAGSTGLIILTNDGELTHRLTHPRFGVIKTYVARVAGALAPEEMLALERSPHLGATRARGATVRVLRRGPDETLLELKIAEGRNDQVRRVLARLGHKVRRLHRSAIGPVSDRGLKTGKFRYLLATEVAVLRKAAGM